MDPVARSGHHRAARVHPQPRRRYQPGTQGVAAAARRAPLTSSGTHSTYGNCWWLQWKSRRKSWINPIDAKARGIEFGDRVKVFNGPRRFLRQAKIRPRIMPGVVSLLKAHGMPNAAGERHQRRNNVRGTKLLPTALAKGTPHHPISCRWKKRNRSGGRPLLRAAVSQPEEKDRFHDLILHSYFNSELCTGCRRPA